MKLLQFIDEIIENKKEIKIGEIYFYLIII